MTAMRPPRCARCDHAPETHHERVHACCARGCDCPRWDARRTELPTPTRIISDPATKDGPR